MPLAGVCDVRIAKRAGQVPVGGSREPLGVLGHRLRDGAPLAFSRYVRPLRPDAVCNPQDIHKGKACNPQAGGRRFVCGRGSTGGRITD